MLKRGRLFLGLAVGLAVLAALPVPAASALRMKLLAALKFPLSLSRSAAQTAADLVFFHRNAAENRRLKDRLARSRLERVQLEELRGENVRLTELLGLRAVIPAPVGDMRYARVIGKSPAAWSSVFLLDKGARNGVRANQLVLARSSLIGKVIEAGGSTSKALLITDPNFRIGVIVQRTRQEGVLFGTASGECRVKYLTLSTPLERGDIIETAGYGGFFQKGLVIGLVDRAWKEPGQIYQVAKVVPFADLRRTEEVAVIE